MGMDWENGTLSAQHASLFLPKEVTPYTPRTHPVHTRYTLPHREAYPPTNGVWEAYREAYHRKEAPRRPSKGILRRIPSLPRPVSLLARALRTVRMC